MTFAWTSVYFKTSIYSYTVPGKHVDVHADLFSNTAHTGRKCNMPEEKPVKSALTALSFEFTDSSVTSSSSKNED